MRRDLVSEVIYTLSLIILKEGEKAAELNVEVRKPEEFLSQVNISSVVVPELI